MSWHTTVRHVLARTGELFPCEGEASRTGRESWDAGQRGGDQVRATRAVRSASVVTGSATIASTPSRVSATA